MNHDPQRAHTGCSTGRCQVSGPSSESVVTEENGDVLQEVLKRGPCLVFFFLGSKAWAEVQGTWTFIPWGLITFSLLVSRLPGYDVKRLFIIWETNTLAREGSKTIIEAGLDAFSTISVQIAMISCPLSATVRKVKTLGKLGGNFASMLTNLRKLQNCFDFYCNGSQRVDSTQGTSIAWEGKRNTNSRAWGGAQHVASIIPPGGSDTGVSFYQKC